jgi:hypothetical protein
MRYFMIISLLMVTFVPSALAGRSVAQDKLYTYCETHGDPAGLLKRPDVNTDKNREKICGCVATKFYAQLTQIKANATQNSLNIIDKKHDKEVAEVEKLKTSVVEAGRNVTEALIIESCKPYIKLEKKMQSKALTSVEAQAEYAELSKGVNAAMGKHGASAYMLDVYCRRKARFVSKEEAYVEETTPLKQALAEIESNKYDVVADEWLMKNHYSGVFRPHNMINQCGAIFN